MNTFAACGVTSSESRPQQAQQMLLVASATLRLRLRRRGEKKKRGFVKPGSLLASPASPSARLPLPPPSDLQRTLGQLTRALRADDTHRRRHMSAMLSDSRERRVIEEERGVGAGSLLHRTESSRCSRWCGRRKVKTSRASGFLFTDD